MALIPIFAILVYYGNDVSALAIFLIAGLSDGVDGFIARRLKQESELGTILDPIADKLLMTTAFIVLAIPSVFHGNIRFLPVPFWVSAAVIGRDVLIITIASAIILFTGFRGFRPSWWGKASTFVQVVGVTMILVSIVTKITYYLPTVYFMIALLTVISGLHYIFQVTALMKADANQQGMTKKG